jgi:hypothetical protein
MQFLRGLGFFLLGWILASMVASLVIGVVGARATSLGDSAQLLAALAGGIAMLVYLRNTKG